MRTRILVALIVGLATTWLSPPARAASATRTLTAGRTAVLTARVQAGSTATLRIRAGRCAAVVRASLPPAVSWRLRLAARRAATRALGRLSSRVWTRVTVHVTGARCTRVSAGLTFARSSPNTVSSAAGAIVASPVAANGLGTQPQARQAPGEPIISRSLSDVVGVSSHLFWFGRSYLDARLAQLRAAGMHWIRDDFNWPQLEPQKGTFDWSRTDNLMAAAAHAGVDVDGILTYSPPWASSDPTGGGNRAYPPVNDADYGAIAAAIVARYGAGGTFWQENPGLAQHPLRALELWNEPWLRTSWGPDPDPAAYARLVRATASAVPNRRGVQFLMSGDLLQVRRDGAPTPWLDTIASNDPGVLGLVDGLSVHPYPQPFNRSPDDTSGDRRWRFDRVPLAESTATAAGHPLPIWITEIGWSTAPASDGGVTPDQQATYVTDAVRTATTAWAPFVQHVFVYTLTDSPTEPDLLHRDYGLMDENGNPKPAWTALAQMIAQGVTPA